MCPQIPCQTAGELSEIVGKIKTQGLDGIAFENGWQTVHDLGTTQLNGYRLKTRLGTRDGSPVFLIQFRHKKLSAATVVDLEFSEKPSGKEIVEGLDRVCDTNIYTASTTYSSMIGNQVME